MSLAEDRCTLLMAMLRPDARPQAEFGAFRAAVPAPSLGHLSVAEMASYPGKIGIVVVDARQYQGGNAAKHWSRAAYEVCEKASRYCCLVSLIAGNTVAGEGKPVPFNSRIAASLGMEVAYDPAGILGCGCVDISDGALRIFGSALELNALHLEKTKDRVKDLVRIATLKDLADAANKFVNYTGREYFWSYSVPDPVYRVNGSTVPQIAADLTFGKWDVDGIHEGDNEVMEALNGLHVSNLADAEAVTKMKNICAIWKHVVADWGFDFSLDKVMATGRVREVGHALGVDSFVDAYLSGVPIEDVLA